jgi:hypothetical protein
MSGVANKMCSCGFCLSLPGLTRQSIVPLMDFWIAGSRPAMTDEGTNVLGTIHSLPV